MTNAERQAAYQAAQIQRAAYFTACLYVGPGRYLRRTAASLEEARRIARDELAQLAEFGRGVMIYAVSPEGWTTHVE